MLFAKLSEKVMCKIQNVQEADSRQKWGPPSETCDGTCGLAQDRDLPKVQRYGSLSLASRRPEFIPDKDTRGLLQSTLSKTKPNRI